MKDTQVIQLVEQSLLLRQLSPIEKLVLSHSWLGQPYNKMVSNSSYQTDYLKVIGHHLWQELSGVLGEKVSKKNLHLVLKPYLPKDPKINELPVEHNLPVHSSTQIKEIIESPGTPLPLNSSLYIERPLLEQMAYEELAHSGSLICIKAPKKMGKTSLLYRLLARAEAWDYQTVFIDLREAEKAIFSSFDKFLRWLTTNISHQLNVNPNLDRYWDTEVGSKVSCKLYFDRYLLPQVPHPIVLAFDEFDQLLEYPEIAQDFLNMLRVWHERSQQNWFWQKLRLVLAYATEIYIPQNMDYSPFNVGFSLKLSPFNLEQIQDLAKNYGLIQEEDIEGLMPIAELVGGHPYLIGLALYSLSQSNITPEELLATAPTQTGIFARHLRGCLAILKQKPQLLKTVRQLIHMTQSISIEALIAHKLESIGLIKMSGNSAKFSCELYRLYFSEQLSGDQNC